MTIVFITGANKGLGYETARRLKDLGHTPIIGARDLERGRDAADKLGVRFVQIDVTSEESVRAAADDVAANEGVIDVLVNNAGVNSGQAAPEHITGTDADRVFATNVGGVVRVTNLFLPLLRKSTSPAVVNVSSGMGSFARTTDPTQIEGQFLAPVYTASKAALTMLTTQFARAIPEIRFNAADPGYTQTDFTGNQGGQSVTEGTDAIIALIVEDAEAGTGRIIDRAGLVPW